MIHLHKNVVYDFFHVTPQAVYKKKSEVIKDKYVQIRGRIVAKYFQEKKLVLAIKQILRPSFRF